MKYIILSADSTPSVYLVPDNVSENLHKYCNDFWEWMRSSPHAEEYRIDMSGSIGFCYTERDFIKYLNEWVFPDNPSRFIETLDNGISEKYEGLVKFNF